MIGRDTWERSPARMAIAVAVGLAVAVSLPSLVNGFVFDDAWIIVGNDSVHRIFPIGRLLTASYWPEGAGDTMWRPLTTTGFAVQWVVGGGGPLVFHFFSVLLYAAVCGVAAALCVRLFSPALGLIAGALFAVHPVHVEVTANAVGQAELWAALWYLVVLLAAFERSGARTPRARAGLLAVALGATVLALGAKEHPVTLPGALVLVWWLRGRAGEGLGPIMRREWLVMGVVIALVGAYVFARARLLGDVAASGGAAIGLSRESAVERTIVMLPVSLRWIELLFAPLRLSADYSPQHLVPQPFPGVAHAAAVLAWGGLVGLAWHARKRFPAVLAGVALFLVTISVVSNVVAPLEVLLAERLLFLPSFGWAMAVAGLALAVWQWGAQWKRGVAIGLALVLAGFALRSMMRATVWRSDDVLFAQMLEEAPLSFRGHWVKAAQAFSAGDSVLGEREMRQAIQLNPEYPQPAEDLGRLYAQTGRYGPAVPLLERVVELDSTRVGAALALALSLSRIGESERAVGVLDAAARVNGEGQALLAVRTEVLRRAGDFNGAVAAARRAVERDPASWRVRMMLAETAAMAGDCPTALAEAETAERTAPEAFFGEVRALRERLANRNGPCK